MRLKLLTLNLHCFAEEDIPQKQQLIVQEIIHKNPDIIFLQEVVQTHSLRPVKENIKADNYGYTLQHMLEEQGLNYFYYYEAIKIGFGIYDEGLGILSKYSLSNKAATHISKTNDYQNWKTRKVLTCDVNMDGHDIRVATTHFGWSDGYEVFEDQFQLASKVLIDCDLAILAGDFNVESGSKEYQYIKNRGWHDVFEDNEQYKNAMTFSADSVNGLAESRIDYIMTNKKVKLTNQAILFDRQRVSDHFGVFAEIEL